MSNRRSYFVPRDEIEANRKSALRAALLAVFLGVFGAHRFYLGRNKSGTTILLINLLSFGLALFITLPLVLIEGAYLASLASKRERTNNPPVEEPDFKEQSSATNQQFKADMGVNNAQLRKDISDIFARPKSQSKPEATDLDIIDVYESAPGPVPIPTAPLDSTNWLHLLEIPYERESMRVPQIKEETLKLYVELCNLIDKELRNEQANVNTLLKLKHELDRSGQYYGNILYTIYCVAEGEVEHHYSGSGYNNSFSYDLLHKHANEHFAELVKDFCEIYVTTLPPADESTRRTYRLTPTGLPHAWWDVDGLVRSRLSPTKTQTRILERTFYRSTVVMQIPEIRLLVAMQYLAAMEVVGQNLYRSSEGWPQQTVKYLKYVFGERSNYDFYDYSVAHLTQYILKLCEQTIRQNIPYSRLLKTEMEIADIKTMLPRTVSKAVLARATHPVKPITLSSETVEALRKQNPQAWKRGIAELEGASPEHCAGTLELYKNDPEFSRIARQAVRRTSNHPVSCLVACYAYCTTKVDSQHEVEQPVVRAIKAIITHPLQQKAFLKLVQQKLRLDTELIKALGTLTKPPVRSVKLDTQKIKAAQAAHDEAVKQVTGYLGEDTELAQSASTPIQQKNEITINDLFGDGSTTSETSGAPDLNSDQVEFLQMLDVADYQLDVTQAEVFARSKHKLLGSLLQGINRQYYELLEDQLLCTVDDKITIDEAYREQVKEALRHDNNPA